MRYMTLMFAMACNSGPSTVAGLVGAPDAGRDSGQSVIDAGKPTKDAGMANCDHKDGGCHGHGG